MTGASASMIGWAVAMSTAGLDKGAPRVKVLQVRTPRTVGASAAEEKKCAKNPVELARVKQRQGESTSVYVERYKDECIHVKACPEILKISGFMNGINNPELIKRLNDRVPQTFDELMKRTRSFIQGEAAAADSRKGYSNNRSQEQSRRQSNDQKKAQTSQNHLQCAPEEQRVGNGYCEYHRQKGHTTNECVQLRQLIDKLVKEGNGSPGERTSSNRKQAKSQSKFTQREVPLLPLSNYDNVVVDPLTIDIKQRVTTSTACTIDGEHLRTYYNEHCFQDLRPEVKYPPSPYNGFIGRPGSQRYRGPIPAHGLCEKSITMPGSPTPVMVKKAMVADVGCSWTHRPHKACPKDCYPPTRDRWKVSPYAATPSSDFLTHIGYHQIQMAKDDEEKTAFHTSQGVYCYTKMPFGLKNAGATYQRLVDNAFEGQVGRNLEVYVDDLVIKSHTEDIEGMFLGYLIETDGIKPCPEKTKAVIQLPSPRTMKEVQSRCVKKGDFRWTTEAEEAFTQLKQHIAALPTLVAPRPGEELIMYLSATHGAISAVLLTDRDSVQTPVYFVSKALKETEINYTRLKADPGAVCCWEHNITYRPRTAVKGQILMDFLIEKPETDICPPPERSQTPRTMDLIHGWIVMLGRHEQQGVKYEALLAGLRIAARMGVRNLEANVDSRLVANHVLGEYVAKEDNMVQYLDKTKSLIQGFDRFTIRQVPRGDNKKADALNGDIKGGDRRTDPTWMTPYTSEIKSNWRIEFHTCAIRPTITKWIEAKAVATITGSGDFVYRANDASHAEDTGKLGPKWEGPYEVTEALGKGAYKLRDMDGRELPRTWNICNLKKCYL
ncbi:reverse transcriptase domain-containing protein [Tanacetum coccineum]